MFTPAKNFPKVGPFRFIGLYGYRSAWPTDSNGNDVVKSGTSFFLGWPAGESQGCNSTDPRMAVWKKIIEEADQYVKHDNHTVYCFLDDSGEPLYVTLHDGWLHFGDGVNETAW